MHRPRPVRPSRLRVEPREDRLAPAGFRVTTDLDAVTRPTAGGRSARRSPRPTPASAPAPSSSRPASFQLAPGGPAEKGNVTGDFDITGTPTVRGAGRGRTFVDGRQRDRVFDAIGAGQGSIKVVFRGLTIRNGGVAGDRGGIQADTDLLLSDCAVSGNRSSGGAGGIHTAPR